MITYLAPVTLLLDHGMATNNTVKVEFHFDSDLPPAETVSGNIGPIQCTIRARMPERPLRSGSMKNVASMRYPASYTTLTSCSPASAAPASGRRWHLLLVRYAHEYEIWTIDIAARAPDAGIRDRLQRWASYNVAHPDPGGRSARYSNRNCASRFAASRGAGVPAACGSRLPSRGAPPEHQPHPRQRVRREPRGWRARCLRLALAVERIDAEDDWAIWQQALATAALVPGSKAKRFKNTLAELANADARSLPLKRPRKSN